MMPPDRPSAGSRGQYSREQRGRITAALEAAPTRLPAAGLACPACGASLTVSPVQPSARVGYVRHRVLVVCPGCRRSGAFDVRAGGPP